MPTRDDSEQEAMTHHVQRPSTAITRVLTPTTIDAALRALAEPSTKPIAGGTDLMVELDRGEHRGLSTLVDISRIPGLDTITETDTETGGEITIGPLVTHNQCVASDVLRRAAVPLVQASWEVGSPQLRNRATIAGNIVTASPANDTLSPLVALDARVTLQSITGRREVPLARFVHGVRRTDLQPGELLTAISFPALGPGWHGVFLKLGLRRAQAISVVHVAVVGRLDRPVDAGRPGTVRDIRLALGSVAPTIVRAERAEQLLAGSPLGDAAIARAAEVAAADVEPIDDLRAPAVYRRRLVAEMVRRALRALADGDAVVPENPPLLAVTGAAGPGPVADGTDNGRREHRSGEHTSAEHTAESLISATVNGGAVSGPGVGLSLLDWLRSRGFTGVKEGCAEGECGSCTVDLDGRSVLGCLIPATRAEGARVTTIEGLADEHGLHRLQQAFIDSGAVQCGFCIPGFLMSGAKLLEEHPNPSEAQIKSGLSGNLCRCTGYYKIEDAVRVALSGSDQASEAGS